jgi:hypothetical protein
MALTELTALDNAYAALQPLGQAARRRALQWLSDALLPGQTPHQVTDTAEPAPTDTVADATPPARLREAASPKRIAAPAHTPSPAPRGGRRLKGATKHSAVRGERPYRRMPDPDTIMKAYRKVGSVSGLADRFEVPRHTVNHWARRLRSQGYDIGRGN